jgi:hypothetical protein
MREMKKMGGKKTKIMKGGMKGGKKTKIMKGGKKTKVMKSMGKKTEMRNMKKGMDTKVENFKDMMYKKFGGKT